RGGEALVEAGVIAPYVQHAVVQRDAIGPAHAARVEVLHDQPVAGLGGADDADRVGEQLVVVAGALNAELAAFQPLEPDAAPHDLVHERKGCLGGPRADQRIQRLKYRISLSHVIRTIAARPTHRSTSSRPRLPAVGRPDGKRATGDRTNQTAPTSTRSRL